MGANNLIKRILNKSDNEKKKAGLFMFYIYIWLDYDNCYIVPKYIQSKQKTALENVCW